MNRRLPLTSTDNRRFCILPTGRMAEFNTYDLSPKYRGPMHRAVSPGYLVDLWGEVVFILDVGTA
ncbi:hypothetical protein BJX99DRAFT_241147 [Aspergillus californicus]